jgi:hypothetical protein
MGDRLTSLERAWPFFRDLILFFVGVTLLVNEALAEARPPVMGVFLVVAGAPLPIRADERRQRRRGEP